MAALESRRLDGAPTLEPPDAQAEFDGDLLASALVVPAAEADGYSHIPLNLGEDTAFIGGEPGNYHYGMVITDTNGDGWRVIVSFTIVE